MKFPFATSPAEAKREANRLRSEERKRLFLRLLEEAGLPRPALELHFHPTRQWRWDFAWANQKLALEVDGGIHVGGKHGRGVGIAKDHEKGNAAAVLGWRVLRVQPRQLALAETVDLVGKALGR